MIAFGFDVAISNPLLVSWAGADVAIPPFSDDLSADLIDTGVAGSVGAEPGITDPAFTLAVLHFVAIGEGALDLGVFSDLGDLNEGLIYLIEAARDLTANTQVTRILA